MLPIFTEITMDAGIEQVFIIFAQSHHNLHSHQQWGVLHFLDCQLFRTTWIMNCHSLSPPPTSICTHLLIGLCKHSASAVKLQWGWFFFFCLEEFSDIPLLHTHFHVRFHFAWQKDLTSTSILLTRLWCLWTNIISFSRGKTFALLCKPLIFAASLDGYQQLRH